MIDDLQENGHAATMGIVPSITIISIRGDSSERCPGILARNAGP
jgi:hypothetical protein